MARFLIQAEMRSEQPTALHRNAQRHLRLTRAAVRQAGGTLEDCWFTRESGRIVGIVSVTGDVSEETLRASLSGAVPVGDISLMELVSVEDVLAELTDERVEYAIAELLDPVDRASALSFPASDPPTWPVGKFLEVSQSRSQ
jgi:hypothetical protein